MHLCFPSRNCGQFCNISHQELASALLFFFFLFFLLLLLLHPPILHRLHIALESYWMCQRTDVCLYDNLVWPWLLNLFCFLFLLFPSVSVYRLLSFDENLISVTFSFHFHCTPFKPRSLPLLVPSFCLFQTAHRTGCFSEWSSTLQNPITFMRSSRGKKYSRTDFDRVPCVISSKRCLSICCVCGKKLVYRQPDLRFHSDIFVCFKK